MNFKVNLFFHPSWYPYSDLHEGEFFFFLMENRGIEDPPSQLNGKFHFFLETVFKLSKHPK